MLYWLIAQNPDMDLYCGDPCKTILTEEWTMTIDILYWVMSLEFLVVIVYLGNIKATVDRIETNLESEE